MAIQHTVFHLFLGILLFTGTSFSAGEDAPVVDSPRLGLARAPERYYTVLGDRDRHSLDGRWRFRLDREQCGEEEGWFTRTLEGRFSSVPGAWQYVFDDLHETTGVGWYQRDFELDAQLRGRRIAAWGLDDVYGSLAGLARQHDWSAFYDLKDEMEQIRMNPDLSGYMITDLANIGPFVHGLLDYDLSLRPFHQRLAEFQTADPARLIRVAV